MLSSTVSCQLIYLRPALAITHLCNPIFCAHTWSLQLRMIQQKVMHLAMLTDFY